MGAESAMELTVPVTYDVLKEKYRSYNSPKDKIARLVSAGDLTRLKKGLFLPCSFENAAAASRVLIANVLRGPSYVSLQTALSYYGMIPERVYSTRSMTTKRSKVYQTQLGRFDYSSVKPEYFSIGIKSLEADGVSFLIASPEKAICDMIVATPKLRIQSAKAMREYLEEDMRIDISILEAIDFSIFDSVIATGVKRREIGLLKEYCRNG